MPLSRAPAALLVATALLAVAALLAGCGGSGPTAGRPGPSKPSSESGSGIDGFRPIVEPFDPAHAAEVQSEPSDCGTLATTVAIEECWDGQAESLDARIDLVQVRRYRRASASERARINADDAAWLAARPRVCQAAYHTGGTIDLVDIAGCLRDESAARLDALTGARPSVAHLSGTDNTDLAFLDYFTTADGSRLGLIHTQGDQSGGAIVSWVVIGGYRGFTVEPDQFPFVDGAFRRAGVIEGPDPKGHVVAAGRTYQFSLDYPSLGSRPGASDQAAGFAYSPGGRTLAVFS